MERLKGEVADIVFSSSGLEIIWSNFEPGGHETILYFVPPPKASGRVCQDCENAASFILFDKDHDSSKSVNMYCINHASPEFIRLYNARKAG